MTDAQLMRMADGFIVFVYSEDGSCYSHQRSDSIAIPPCYLGLNLVLHDDVSP